MMVNPQEARKEEISLLIWRQEQTQMICQWINDVEKLTPESDQRILGAMLWRSKFASNPMGAYVSGSEIANAIRMNQREYERIEKNLLNIPCQLSQAQAGLKEWLEMEKAIEAADLGALKAVNRIENVIGETYTLVPESSSDHWLRAEDAPFLLVDLAAQKYYWRARHEEGGDVIFWVMKRKLMTFQQAVAWLTRRAQAKEK